MKRIRDALLLQKRELEKSLEKKYVDRDFELFELDKDIIKVIIGPRRAGKSFFAMHELKKFGYANFDDEILVEVEDYNDIVETVKELYDNPEVLFLDEIQNLPKWELFVNRLQRQGYNLIVTGSNSNLLSKELATHLTGRHSTTIVFPFSFKEYLSFFNEELTESEKKSKLISYLKNGGYPEPLVKDLDYQNYLTTLFDSILFKDIIKRHSIKYPKGLEELSRFLISNFANLTSYNKLKDLLGINSVHTIKKYVSYLEEAFLVFELKRFSFKVKEQEKSNKKIYIIDNGLITAKSFEFSNNVGKLYENAVAIELHKKELKKEIEIYYYSKNYEVDFVVKKGRKIDQLIQVCYDANDERTKKREIRGLLHASKELKCENLIIITENQEKTEKSEWFGLKGTIKFIPLWKYLLMK
ncbi:MAG: ATP-binding protein [Nanoarchaeota archaeon]|nr:ATP-binding protein [Nanoarchaeota archaeon]